MKLFKMVRTTFTALLLFVSVAAIFNLPGLVRCGGEVDPEGSSSITVSSVR